MINKGQAHVYLIGYLFGFYVARTDRNYHGWMDLRYICWPIIIGGYLFCIYSPTPWIYGRPFNPIWSAILWPLNRIFWMNIAKQKLLPTDLKSTIVNDFKLINSHSTNNYH
ncbi:hypothetical protein DERF_011981 [Dermatophagoides farinae]|uniref:Uncharacterized protein n=1 Tax=Dermatophagoides farinae TaxID=6954 RepID=A0A922HP01_DERFA|nr:hypothetical protein DERF_011981 [Dermatophagoides farinae]